MPTAEKSPTLKPKPKTSAPKKSAKSPVKKSAVKKSPSWKELPDAELAEYLLAHQTLPDATWKERAGGKSRQKGESREVFIRRVLLDEEASA